VGDGDQLALAVLCWRWTARRQRSTWPSILFLPRRALSFFFSALLPFWQGKKQALLKIFRKEEVARMLEQTSVLLLPLLEEKERDSNQVRFQRIFCQGSTYPGPFSLELKKKQ
jgi:hypothetical protein